ncbi:MAG TPA: hypothetical protein VKZ60_00275 [Chloroflexota bacterium]|nr:hypothetical protein [Chloroflexota bacterium]
MDAERRLLLTGFEPWAAHAANPAAALATRLDGWRHRGWRVYGVVLPVALAAAPAELAAAWRDLRPHAVLHLGLAASRTALTVERWAHNVADFPVPDNRGAQPRGEPLAEDGPARLAATLPVGAAVRALAAAGVPAAPSDTAGQFVCNAVLYAALRRAAAARCAGPVGFVHLPGPQALPLAAQERALERLLRWLVAAQP